ncbi:3-oxoacyl-[acyl-carrier-protein] synthase II [Saccharopolyspora erythraea NRRL 2338]|uniref:3-oxoacyl-[acyl-carrier-protein] synthase 2 n=2 Tax=Saccharopolyspora erythraea TaxID=1836 RepID=A4FH77_SACEN|nr:beta-ketoacyl-[acyl-carrier-protein] synthase family protein [Saccharopolyspora erythraea]EQD82175.1 3-oxoacyl-ACP synthase [Saccharopolyspora erythraea D]PFG97102.1 3-oxoacyl-[acyl-carrier-protein] synthase II [Saccharopolyspora erythraea NRRL 2338]QRK87311.1 beta-ketoacyl-[acyl-carrier-protein] synthase family protein [Saccharopolyspora erythraea]CAM03402.1 ketoacyl-ACP synthase (typeII) [Saccharopolyspora erythraea NRRL 2338]
MTGLHEVVVTGMGVVSPLGVGTEQFHANQQLGRSAVRRVTAYDPGDDPVRIAAEVDLPEQFQFTRRDQLRTDRCTQLAIVAARLGVEEAKLDLAASDTSRIGVVIGSGMGGVGTWERNCLALHESGVRAMRTKTVPMSMINDPSASIAIRYGTTGPCTTVTTACASGADALVAAAQMIRLGEADVVLAGGAEAPLSRSVLAGFARLGALSEDNDAPESACRPFSADRTGFVMGEGAAVLVLESAEHATARGAQVRARMAGYGRSADAYHVTMPHPEAAGARAAIVAALRDAGAQPSDVDFVNAHGTGTALNDHAEALAMRAVFGTGVERIPVTATKSLTGHSLGAAGAVEAVATVQAVSSGVIPPTANLRVPDPELGIDVVHGGPREARINLALSNSFAFGGHNVVLAFAPPL